MTMDRSDDPQTTANDDRFDIIERQLIQGAKRMDSLESSVKQNTELTQEIRDVMVAAKVGFRVLGGVGTMVKWFGVIAAGALSIYVAVYAALHGGHPPR